MDTKDNLLGVLRTLYKWRKAIIRVVGVVAIGAVVISLLLPNYYKSTTVIYAANPQLAQPEQLFGGSQGYSVYGNENDIDRILTIAQSEELLNFLIDTFNLYQHYDIDSSKEKARHKVRLALLDLYEVTKTKYDAIELTVEDKDPVFAANMTNSARNKIDLLAQQLIKQSQRKTLLTLEKSIAERDLKLKDMIDTLAFIRESYGIYNIGVQSELLSTMVANTETKLTFNKAQLQELEGKRGVDRDTITFMKARIKGLETELESLTEKDSESNFNLARFNEGTGPVEVISQIYGQSRLQLTYDKERYNHLKAAYESKVPAVHLIEKGQVPVIKSRPKRSIVCISAVLIAFLFSVIGVLLIDAYREVKWKEVFRDA